jgi:hypothetical protein
MNETLIKKFRWFWSWQDDKEEQWLGEMAWQGLHLIKPDYFGQYYFTKGKPQEVAYRLDFVTLSNKKEDYYQLFRDAKWEHVGEMGGWQYWRKPVENGKTPEIFTDSASKVQKYLRMLGWMTILMPIFIINMINANKHFIRYEDGIFNNILSGIYFLLFLVFLILVFSMVMLLRRISTLKRY